jgi:hypothetical protein
MAKNLKLFDPALQSLSKPSVQMAARLADECYQFHLPMIFQFKRFVFKGDQQIMISCHARRETGIQCHGGKSLEYLWSLASSNPDLNDEYS